MKNKYVNYDNSLQVLNEGFFDFVKKMASRLFHALFKAKKYEDLSDRLDKIEQIIKYGNTKVNEVASCNVAVTNINETIRRRRITEDKDTSTKKTDSSVKDTSIKKTPTNTTSNVSDTSKGKSADEIEDTKVTSSSVKVNLNSINTNIPSFPAVAKKLVDALADQLTSLKKSVPESKLISDIDKVRAGATLPPNYAQQLELVASNFLRKYSGGGINLPQPKKGENMSAAELNQWKDLLTKNKSMANMDSFRSISDSMRKVIDVYKQEFTTFLNEFNAREDKHIQQNKDGKASTADIKFKTDWNTKLNHKMNAIADSCIDFIPVAINEYIIKSGIYKGALDYISKIIELLFANTRVVEMDNILLNVSSKLQNSEINENAIKRSKTECLSNLNAYLSTLVQNAQQTAQQTAQQPVQQSVQGNPSNATPAAPASNEAATPAPATNVAPVQTAAPAATTPTAPAAPAGQTPVRSTSQVAPQQAAQAAQQAAPQQTGMTSDMRKKVNEINAFISGVNSATSVACSQSFISFKKDEVYKTLSQVKGLDGKALSQNSSFNDYMTSRISKLSDNAYDNDGIMAVALIIIMHAADSSFTFTYSKANGEKIKFV